MKKILLIAILAVASLVAYAQPLTSFCLSNLRTLVSVVTLPMIGSIRLTLSFLGMNRVNGTGTWVSVVPVVMVFL